MDSHVPMDLVVPNTPVTFNQRWEIYKQLLKQLYLDENLKLPKIKSIMRDTHNFDAEVHQYKYRFDKWGWKKSISSRTKAQIIDKSQQRLNAGQETVVRYQKRTVDTRKLIRFEKAQMKKHTSDVLFSQNSSRSSRAFNGVAGDTMTFMNWNLPYSALLNMFPQLQDHPSPAAMSVSTPSDVSIASPAANMALSPGLSQAVNLRTARQNAAMFVAGDFEGLLKAFSNEDKKVFSTWMHEFWYFSFITAKHWGRGPRNWSVDDLWQNFQNATSPGLLAPTSPAHQASTNPGSIASERRATIPTPGPSPLCRWSIHVSMREHTNVEWLEEDAQTGSDNTSLQEWPDQWLTQSLEQKLQHGLESNSFSTVSTSQLPVDIGYVSQAALKSPDEIWREALGFAIMGRNADLVERMITPCSEEEEKVVSTRISQGFYPAHLAAAYLDGGKTCCQIMYFLLFQSRYVYGAFDRDSNGHTVLDAILLRILRSHSNTPLEVVNNSLRGFQGHAGEEVDICGRWDAESHAYRKLVGGGAVKIPRTWKHKFCHTSIQAVCHCIEVLSEFSTPATSGLFVRTCFNCGLKLELQPLHALILTTFEILKHGMNGEDLFGMICCLFQFTVVNADKNHTLKKSHVSIDLLQDHVTHDGCTHEELSPFELATRIDSIAKSCASQEAYKGWTAFVVILQQIEEQRRWADEKHPPPGYEAIHESIMTLYEDNHAIHDSVGIDKYLSAKIFDDRVTEASESCKYHPRAFGRNCHLGHIWAACQAELLTYRRQKEGQPWFSQRITIDTILECLRTGDHEVLPYVKRRMLKPYCACGGYGGYSGRPIREDVCTSYFSNLDDWHRTSFILPFEY